MGRKWKILWLVLAVVLLGLAYHRTQRRQDQMQGLIRQAEALEAAVAVMEREKLEYQRNLAKWYNYNLKLGTEGLERAYETILDFGQGRMAVLGVPEWELRMPIYHGGGGAVSHDPATPFPLGGREDHTVIMVSDLLPWRPGLTLYIECLEQRLLYRVESIQVMGTGWSAERPTEGGQDLLTLVYDRENTRTLIRCVRCGELVMREESRRDGFHAVLTICLLILMLPVICRLKWRSSGAQRRQIRGFYRKNRGKTKLS